MNVVSLKPAMSEITLMLEAISAGDDHASEQLLPLV